MSLNSLKKQNEFHYQHHLTKQCMKSTFFQFSLRLLQPVSTWHINHEDWIVKLHFSTARQDISEAPNPVKFPENPEIFSIATISGKSGNIQLKMLLESCDINSSRPWIRASAYLFSSLDIRMFVASATAECCHETYFVFQMILTIFPEFRKI